LFGKKKDDDKKQIKKLMEEFHKLNLNNIMNDIKEKNTIKREHMDSAIMYVTYTTQENLNIVTNILVAATIILVFLTAVLLYYTIVLVSLSPK
jgi:hypothetical protein